MSGTTAAHGNRVPEQSLIDSFLHHLRTERRLSPRTIEHYGRDLALIGRFLSAHQITSWSTVDNGVLRVFLRDQHHAGKSSRSLQRILSSARTFYRYLIRHGRVENNPALAVKPPRGAQRLPKTLPVDQVNVLFANDDPKTPLEMRDRAMIELFYSSGLRLSELVRLDIPDIDFEDRMARVVGKGNKERVIPIGRHALQAIQKWLEVRPQLLTSGTDALFVSRRGVRITPRSVQLRLKEWCKKKSIAIPLHPHLLRHSFASHLLESSGELRAVQELLGHSSISTTQIYTHLDFQHLATIYDKSHPRAKKK
jgi:integrase/recombinase XerC